jgi:outer membrane protein assembly factor BamB
VTTDPGIVLVTVYATDPGRTPETRIEARESRSGRKLWQRSGMGLVDASGDLAIVTDHRGWGGNLEVTRSGTVEAVDLRTGALRWSRAVGASTLVAAERTFPLGPHGDARAGAAGLVELDQQGALRNLDPATGAARSTVRVHLTGPPLGLMIEGGMAVVTEGRPGEDPVGLFHEPTSVAGYDLETGEARWRTTAPDFAMPCGGRYRCEYEPESLTVTEPTTGEVRYRGQAGRVSFRGDLMIVSRLASLNGGPSTGSDLWDLATGRKVRSFGPWHIATDDPRDGNLAALTGTRGELIVAMLDLKTGAARVIARARDWSGDAYCTFGQRYLACVGSGGVRIWQVPDGVGPAA